MAEPENEDTVVPFIDMPPERDGGMGIVEHGDGIGGVDHGDISGDMQKPVTTQKKGMGMETCALYVITTDWLWEVEDEDLVFTSNKSLIEELDINVESILLKLRYVLMPFKIDEHAIKESVDFWGPFLVVVLYALMLAYGQLSSVAWVLIVWVCGSYFNYVLARLLGSEVTYGGTIGLVGYCLLPLCLFVIPIHMLSGYVSIAAMVCTVYR